MTAPEGESALFNYIKDGGDELALLKAQLEHMGGRLAAELEENRRLQSQNLRKQVEWQPIETAPKDGRWIIGYWTGGKMMDTVFFNGHFWDSADNDAEYESPPQFWQSLPEPPTLLTPATKGKNDG